MATIATDGKGNYVTLDDSGNWVPTTAPDPKQLQGGNRFTDAPQEPPKSAADIDFAHRPASPSPSQEELGIPLPQTTASTTQAPPPPDPIRPGPRTLAAPSLEFHPFAGARPGALGRIGQAAEEGWQGGQVASPNLIMAPVYNSLMGGLGAVFRGGQQLAQETIDPMLPGLGRDVAAMPEAFPLGPRNTLAPHEAPAPPPPPPSMLDRLEGAIVNADQQPPRTPQAGAPTPAPATPTPAPAAAPPGAWVPMEPGMRYPGQQTRINRDTGRPEVFDPTRGSPPAPKPAAPVVPAPEPPPPVAPADFGGTPQPVSAGAAASREGTPSHMLTLTPDEEKAYRSTAEGNRLIETQQPGIADTRQLVPGVEPNSAELEQSVQAARELKSLKLANPDVHADALAASDANNTARQGFYDSVAGSPVQLKNAIDARAAQAEADLKATWGNKTDVTPQPVLDTAQQILQSEDGRRPAVRNAVNSVTKELYDDNGNLITDPQLLYGVRKHIGDMLSKEGAQTDPLAVRAKANLMALRDSLDGVISAGASGFRNYLANFSNASRPIDSMQVLQDARNGLVGAAGRMEYGRFQRFMRDVVDSRQASGVNPYQSISPETMQQLWNLRDDLRRSNAAVELARAAGSDTAQNLVDLVRHGLARGVFGALGAAAGSFLGPIGTGVGASVGAQAGEGWAAGRTARRTYQRGQELLYPTRQNPLTPPPP